MLDQLLGGAKDSVLNDLTSKLGLSGGQANGFLQKALSLLQGAFQGGKIDPAALLKGDLSGILSKLDLGALTGLVGGDAGKAQTGMQSVLAGLVNTVKSNPDAAGLLAQFAGGGVRGGGSQEGVGGLMDKAAGLAGKLFGKQ